MVKCYQIKYLHCSNKWREQISMNKIFKHTAKLLATARMDVPSWRSWTTCATWMGCRYHLILPVVTRALAKCKTREKSVKQDKETEMVCGRHLQNHFLFWGVVLLLPLLSTCYLFHLHQSRWNLFTIASSSKLARLISQNQKLNWLGVVKILWRWSVPYIFFLQFVVH